MADSGSVEQNLKSSYVPQVKTSGVPVSGQLKDAIKKKEAEKVKKNVDKFVEEVRKKFKFIEGVGIVPAQASKLVENEFDIKEEDRKRELVHLLVVAPEKKNKDLPKIKVELIKIAASINNKLWVHLITPMDFWGMGLDSKFEVFEALAMSYPLFDKNGVMAAVRIAQIHKSLVLRKFEKYVTTYAIGGSFVRGDTVKSSDVDVFIIIDDTDVKRMGRIELLEKLRGIIYSYIGEAIAMGGAKVDLNVQIYLLTDFWESVKDAHPVMFTFIRDGIPLYDRGAFLPWKSLLKSGRIKPSPEAIEMFMSTGDKIQEAVDRKIFDIVMHDLYWGTLTPSQGLLMLYGESPQGPKDTVKRLREVFVVKEKLLENKFADILEEIAIKYYKGFEHGKVKPGDIDGKVLDGLVKDSVKYVERLKELRLQIDQRNQEKGIDDIYDGLFSMLSALLKESDEVKIIKAFDKNFIKEGKFPKKYLENIKFVAKVNKELDIIKSLKKGEKVDKDKAVKSRRYVEKARKLSSVVTNALIDYTQRCDFLSMDRARFIVKAKDRTAEVFFLEDVFFVEGAKVKKIIKGKIVVGESQELETQILAQKDKDNKIDVGALGILRKEFGEFELVY